MATTVLSHFRFRWIFFSLWLVWSVLHAFVAGSFGVYWIISITDSLVSNGLLLLASLLLMTILRFYVPQSDRYIMLLGWILVLVFIWLFISRIMLSLLFDDAAYENFLRQSTVIRFCIGFLMLTCVVLMSVAWYNFNEQQAAMARRTEADKINKEAELFKLRQQLQPHFLFNSLNSISALINVQPTQARKMVLQLSEFLRGTLKKEEKQWITLQEEIDYLQLYLEIEKVRFGHRLNTVVEIEEAAQSLLLPALLLQPVVENAIKFGLYDTVDDITISIIAKKESEQLVVEVQNPFDPETTAPRGTGFGLTSIKRRLYLLFGRKDLLTTTANQNLFTITLHIPQQNKV